MPGTKAVFGFLRCTNVVLNANFYGAHPCGHDQSVSSFTGFWLWRDNDTFNITATARRVFTVVRCGDYTWTDTRLGANKNVNATLNSTNCMYGFAAYRLGGGSVSSVSKSENTDGPYSADRNIYLAGSTNIVAEGWGLNLIVQDAGHIIGSTPTWESPWHCRSENITLTAHDLGTTYMLQYRALAGLVTVSGHPYTYIDAGP